MSVARAEFARGSGKSKKEAMKQLSKEVTKQRNARKQTEKRFP
jgi:hypothetical protein